MTSGAPDPSSLEYRFTEADYRRLIDRVASRFAFSAYANRPKPPHVLWRHDVDISPQRALRIATIERAHGVTATYFILLHSPFYNALEERNVECFRAVAQLGHAVGLHFDANFYGTGSTKDGLAKSLETERLVLEDVVGVEPEAVSFHNPNFSQGFVMDAPEYAGMVNAYGRGIWADYRYLSDSNGIWRFERPDELINDSAVERLHVLTHPEWWTPRAMAPRARVQRAVRGRARRTLADYDDALDRMGRPNVR